MWREGAEWTTAAETGEAIVLVEHAERHALAAGAQTMELELLVPTQEHPHTDLLTAWYRRRGYEWVERRPLAELDPVTVRYLAVECEVAVLRKRLAPGTG